MAGGDAGALLGSAPQPPTTATGLVPRPPPTIRICSSRSAPGAGSREHFGLMEALPGDGAGRGAGLRDRDGGEVRVGRDGEPVVRYALSEFDSGPLADRNRRRRPDPRSCWSPENLFSSHSKWVAYEPGDTAAPALSS